MEFLLTVVNHLAVWQPCAAGEISPTGATFERTRLLRVTAVRSCRPRWDAGLLTTQSASAHHKREVLVERKRLRHFSGFWLEVMIDQVCWCAGGERWGNEEMQEYCFCHTILTTLERFKQSTSPTSLSWQRPTDVLMTSLSEVVSSGWVEDS